MLNYFKFSGKDSRDFGILIKSKKTYNAPERDLQFVSVPGRNGDLIIDKGGYKNISVGYDIRVFADRLPDNNLNTDIAYSLSDIKNWLYSSVGDYFELSDSYEPLYYRKACFQGNLQFTSKTVNVIDTTVNFNCKPFKYRKDGKTITEFTSDGIIVNPEKFKAMPLIRLTGSGSSSFVLNGLTYTFDFTGLSFSKIDIDSEKQIIYKTTNPADTTNLMSKYTPPSNRYYPELATGTNAISFLGGTSKIEIIPNWRCI